MRQLEKYIRPHWWFIIFTTIIKLAGTVTELMIPYLMKIILDIKHLANGENSIYLYGGLMLFFAGLTLVLNITANRMAAKSSGRITRAVRHDLFHKLESLSARQMDELTTPSAVSRLTSDTYNINQMLTRFQRMGIRAPIMLVGGIAMMLSMDAALSLVLVAMLPAIAIVVFFVTKKSIPMHVYQQEVLDDVVRTVQENITGVRVIKALSKTEYEKNRFHKVNDELSDAGFKAGLVTSITNPVTTLTLNLGLTVVVLMGAFRVSSGATESSVIVAFLQYFTQILMAMLGITRIFVMCSKGIASANRVADVLELKEDLTVTPAEAEAAENAAHIEFKNVSFSYTGVGKNIDNLSFRLEHGQTLGILGPTGSGKSTIINLLLRLYDADAGYPHHRTGDPPQEIRHRVPKRLYHRGNHCPQYPFLPGSFRRSPCTGCCRCTGVLLHRRKRRRHGCRCCGTGQQSLRWPEAAAADCQSLGCRPGDLDSGRLLLGTGLSH